MYVVLLLITLYGNVVGAVTVADAVAAVEDETYTRKVGGRTEIIPEYSEVLAKYEGDDDAVYDAAVSLGIACCRLKMFDPAFFLLNNVQSRRSAHESLLGFLTKYDLSMVNREAFLQSAEKAFS